MKLSKISMDLCLYVIGDLNDYNTDISLSSLILLFLTRESWRLLGLKLINFLFAYIYGLTVKHFWKGITIDLACFAYPLIERGYLVIFLI